MFVRAAISGVVREALIAAGLTGLMILLFLGSWRSTLIVCISIPLSILTSLAVLSLLGQTINVMTLGGLALAVGILVDDATVEIENTHRNLAMRKPLVHAVLDGASQIAVPTFVSTLVHLHRLRPGAAADRHGAISVHAAGDGGGVRDDGVVSAVANAGADDGGVPARIRDPTCTAMAGAIRAAKGSSASRHTSCSTALFEALRYRYMGLLDWSPAPRAPVLLGVSRLFAGGSLGCCPLVGQRFLPERGFGPDAAARPRPGGHANRGDRAALRRHRAGDPRA